MEQTQTILEQLAKSAVVAMVTEWVKKNEQGSRHRLAHYLCQRLELHDFAGHPRVAGVQKALRTLESKGLWTLPKPQTNSGRSWRPRRLDVPVPVAQDVPGRAGDVQGLHLVHVTSEDDEGLRIWNELVETEHPVKNCRLVGRQLRYLIGSDHGWLGAMGFGSCALRLNVRDAWLGWDEPTRRRFQNRLVGLSRFLIRPQVRCENLASRVLSLCMNRLGADYEKRYEIEPWLVETFVDRERFSGTCFRAANWIYVGASRGRGRSAPTRPVTSRKDIYLYPLKKDWRRAIGLPSPAEKVQPVRLEEALEPGGWIDDEFGDVDLGHETRTQRLLAIVNAKAQNPAALYTECFFGDRHELKALYRLFANPKVTPEAILSGHKARTVGRMKSRKRILIVQDTTDLDFSERLHCNGLGIIGTNQTGAQSPGLKMHSALAVGEDGLPLGVLSTEIYPPETGVEKPQNRPIQEKESYRWLRTFHEAAEISLSLEQTELVCVGDRESDIFELFDLRRRRARNVHLLVRSCHNRRLEDQPKLFDYLADLSVSAKAQIDVPRQREKKGKPSRPGRPALPARKAQVELRWDKVALRAPQTAQTKDLPPIELHALLIVEPHPPEGAKPVRWVLLATLPIVSRKQALRCLHDYTLRWRIEEWHRLLKTGCHIEAHQHQTAERLAKAIAIDAVIAWQAMLLTLLGRKAPDLPGEVIFSPWECRLLEALQPILAPETMEGEKRGP